MLATPTPVDAPPKGGGGALETTPGDALCSVNVLSP